MKRQHFVLVPEHPGIEWPGLLPYRGPGCPRGYRSYQEAAARATRIRNHYNAKTGQSGPSFHITLR